MSHLTTDLLWSVSTWHGFCFESKLPWPSWPLLPSPHEYTILSIVTTITWELPTDTWTSWFTAGIDNKPPQLQFTLYITSASDHFEISLNELQSFCETGLIITVVQQLKCQTPVKETLDAPSVDKICTSLLHSANNNRNGKEPTPKWL